MTLSASRCSPASDQHVASRRQCNSHRAGAFTISKSVSDIERVPTWQPTRLFRPPDAPV